MEFRNIAWIDHNTINADLDHEQFGWIPITMRNGDATTQSMFDQLVNTPNRPPAVPDTSNPEILQHIRNTKTMDKSKLIFNMVNAGIIQKSEAFSFIRTGEIPPSLAAHVTSMSANDLFMSELRWAGDAVISRVDKLLLVAISSLYAANSDVVLDALFEIEV